MTGYRLSDRALADLDQLYEHGIHNFGLRQADGYYDGLIARFQAIVDNPLQWRRVDEVGEGLRRSVFGSHSIYYLIDADDIAIVRILGYQELGGSFDKAKK
ncbi:MAG: type II toxin-antitoxin system RelE/ParE family toxin [Proteobacteria bacterium]|nr:type II toxin-antitoxin system RelE/ParE family toxin [Pseudomonadota bacterium]